MTHRWIQSSCVVVVLNAILVLASILHRQLTATSDLSSTSPTTLVRAATTTTAREVSNVTNSVVTKPEVTNPEVAEFQKSLDAGLAPNLANLEAKPVPEDDKLMAEIRRKAAESFPISDGLSESQSVFSPTNPSSVPTTSNTRSDDSTDGNTSTTRSGLEDTPLTRRTSSIRELSRAIEDLAKLSQDFEREGKSAESKIVREQMLMVEKVMQELLKTPAF